MRNPIFINSAISEDKTKALVCYLDNWQKCQCENYDINSNTFSLNSRNEELNNLICRNEHSSSTILYYSEKTNEYFFGCYGYDYSLLLVKFNSDFEVENLIKLIKIRLTATECGISIIREAGSDIRIYTPFADIPKAV